MLRDKNPPFPLVLIACALLACTPARAPTAQDVATVAVNAVYKALDVAIDIQAPDAALGPEWSAAVDAIETAEKVIRAGQDFCQTIPQLEAVAALVHCTECAAPLKLASEQLRCPQ